ncbi:hypothetical protein AVEN_32841-1 [Araneus ventricosus]|uniref:Uncharacterized protein n=1 Tax=Araneus ventricosus TaxID=182803 RepID=A0A4Y2DYA2_ARAVE|nr:hypothetical protein AVEN_32841-1 [Araneus ventricosus]
MNAVSIPGSEELEVLSPSSIEIVQAVVVCGGAASCMKVTVTPSHLSSQGSKSSQQDEYLSERRQFMSHCNLECCSITMLHSAPVAQVGESIRNQR